MNIAVEAGMALKERKKESLMHQLKESEIK